jgi:hypothetical protein
MFVYTHISIHIHIPGVSCLRLSCCINAFIFCVHYLCLIGRVYVFYVGHVDKNSLHETLFHCNILSKHHHILYTYICIPHGSCSSWAVLIIYVSIFMYICTYACVYISIHTCYHSYMYCIHIYVYLMGAVLHGLC